MTPSEVALPAAMLLVCLAAMFMTGSRAGVVLSLVALVVAFALSFHRHLPRRSGVVILILIGGAVGLVLLQVLGAGVSGRFDIQGLDAGGRIEVYRSTARMISDRPWLGSGLGTFAWAFPAYRSDAVSLWGVWDRAHSTLLELATDLGLPLAILVVLGWLLMFAVLVHGFRTRRRDVTIPIASFSVGLLAIAHSLIDFSLQIPGYALVVFMLLGAGLSQSFRSSTK